MLKKSDSMIDQFSQQLHQLASVDIKRSESLCNRLADELQDELLNHDAMPEPLFNYLLTLLSVAKYYEKPGIWNFILALNTPRDDLSKEQFKKLTNVFLENYTNYSDSDLCLAVCDFIARHIEPTQASVLLNQLKAQEAQKDTTLRGYADEGLYIVGQEIKRASRVGTE
jgi:hypothetical protein